MGRRGVRLRDLRRAAFFPDSRRSSWSAPRGLRDGGGQLPDALRLEGHLVHRREEFRASQIMIDRARANEKIEWALNKQVKDICAGDDGKVRAVVLEDTNTGE